ncbi:guanylate kinase [Alphaproteobacteria bacterium]|nr:guanylate kinase [Alphaproteobacteria bacterium]
MRKGFLFVISGPSAVGKTSVVEEMLRIDGSLSKIITCTTRAKRGKEVEGKDYFFVSEDDFLEHVKKNDFMECSEVYGNFYGVLASTVFEKTNAGIDALLIINWEGFVKIKKAVSQLPVYGFFIVPPSLEMLEQRIRSRSTDSEEVIQTRLSLAHQDMSHQNEFHSVYENEGVTKTAHDILKTINELRKSIS